MSEPGAGLGEVLSRLARGEVLTRDQARAAMDVIMSGSAPPAQIGAFLMGLRQRGETAEEIAGAVDSLRAHALTVRSSKRPLLDTCGTGGDESGTFNISTAAAFVVAGAGVAVAKHGNRSISSRCGSADVLEALGARIDLPPEGAAACLETTGVGFFFAPVHHGAMRHAAQVRKDLGIRTLFNLLGPLANPAGVTHQLLGVYDPRLTETVAEVLGLLGIEGAMVVHGSGGLDEISLAGPTQVSELRKGRVRTYAVEPKDFGASTAPLKALRGDDPGMNATLVRSVLGGRAGAPLDAVCVNAGAALAVTGRAGSLADGYRAARESATSGEARRVLEQFVAFTQNWGT
jgi:anthranilate phosphoribosyltransferase